MLKIYSKRCEYALRVLTQIPGDKINQKFLAVDICRKAKVPLSSARKVLQLLVEHDFLEAVTGPGGGYKLKKKPDKITLLSLISAIDGKNAFDNCIMGLDQCSLKNSCPLHTLWQKVKIDVNREIGKTTLSQLIKPGVKKFNAIKNRLKPLLLLFLFIPISPVFAGEFINKQLPKWLNIDMQLRHRYERRTDFNDTIDDKEGFNLWRTQLGITLKPTEYVKLFYQFQDARLFDYNLGGSKAAFEDWAETKQLWAEWRFGQRDWDKVGMTAMGIKAGRQEFSYGSQRLVGPVNWSNIGQTFDAGKLMFDFSDHKFNADLFVGGKTPVKSPREKNDFYDGSANDRLTGYYVVYKGFSNITVEQYFLNRYTEGKRVSFGQVADGEVDDYTIGCRIKGKLPESPFDYELEAAKQFGKSGSLDADAQMAVIILGYTWDHTWKPRLAFEFDYASGDNHSRDSERNTFDNLYPTNHIFYGYMDFVSLQNINNYRFQFNVFPVKNLEMEADVHLIYLDTSKDNLYGANQAIKRSTASGADTHVGNEVDLLAKYKLCAYADITLGYSHLFAGEFLEDTGASADADFFYAMTTVNF